MKLPTKLPKQTLTTAGIVLVLYTILVYFILPVVVRSNLIEQVTKVTGQTPEVGEVSSNPFTLSLTVHDFSLPDRSGEPLFSLGELYLDFELVSFFTRAYTFSEISVQLPVRLLAPPGGRFR